jgi:aspartate racemase
MKTIGIAAVTAEGAAACYKDIVQMAAEKLGPNEHPEIVLDNPSFATILAAQKERDWPAVANIVARSINLLAEAGADFAVIPANSVHYAYDLIVAQTKIPVLNIVELVARECHERNLKQVAILGVGVTMSDGLYDRYLKTEHVTSVALPELDRKKLDDIIYEELVHGEIVPDSVTAVVNICTRLKARQCDALVIACTELPMLINHANSPLPFIDSTHLLAARAVDYSLGL